MQSARLEVYTEKGVNKNYDKDIICVPRQHALIVLKVQGNQGLYELESRIYTRFTPFGWFDSEDFIVASRKSDC